MKANYHEEERQHLRLIERRDRNKCTATKESISSQMRRPRKVVHGRIEHEAQKQSIKAKSWSRKSRIKPKLHTRKCGRIRVSLRDKTAEEFENELKLNKRNRIKRGQLLRDKNCEGNVTRLTNTWASAFICFQNMSDDPAPWIAHKMVFLPNLSNVIVLCTPSESEPKCASLSYDGGFCVIPLKLTLSMR